VKLVQPRSSGVQHPSPETWIALLTADAIALHLVLRLAIAAAPAVSTLPLYAALLIGGVPLLRNLWRDILTREIGADILAGCSIITAAILGESLVATIIVLMLSGGTALEHYATRRASSVLAAPARRMPRTAHCHIDGRLVDVPVEKVTVGETLVVLPHEVCPADGTVTDGHGTMDEAYLTGEPFEIAKTPGSTVLSGAINGAVPLTIHVDRRPVDSRYAQIVKVIEEAERNRPRLRRIGDRLGAWFTAIASRSPAPPGSSAVIRRGFSPSSWWPHPALFSSRLLSPSPARSRCRRPAASSSRSLRFSSRSPAVAR